MEILKRDNLEEGGFAGLKEHRLIKDTRIFPDNATADGSWSGLENFVYLADARFMPHGETRMHSHHEIDVISVMVDGRISHEGSLAHGQDLTADDVQVQRAGGEGFSHNEINPDDDWNRLIQIWVLPQVAGQPAAYKVYKPPVGGLTRIYGGATDSDFPASTMIDIALLENNQKIDVSGAYLVYVTRGRGLADNNKITDGDLIRGDSVEIKALSDMQIIVIHTGEYSSEK